MARELLVRILGDNSSLERSSARAKRSSTKRRRGAAESTALPQQARTRAASSAGS